MLHACLRLRLPAIIYLFHRLVGALFVLLWAEFEHLHHGALAEHAVDLLVDQRHTCSQFLIVELVLVGGAFLHRVSLLVHHDPILDIVKGA